MTIDQEPHCTTGRGSQLFPVPPCMNKPTEYIFGDPFCKQCADKQRAAHIAMNAPKSFTEEHRKLLQS